MVPYIVEIEYLESTGTQWISSGVYFQVGMDIQIDAIYTDNFTTIQVLIGAGADGGCWMGNVSNNGGTFAVSTQNYSLLSSSKIRTSMLLSYVSGRTNLSNGSRTAYGIRSLNPTTKTFTLFGAGNSFKSSARIYSCVFIYDNAIVADLIPVRVGQTGYLFDKVSKQLFGNSGTGSFVLGPDVAPAAYANEIAFLESTGSQYIDTGINADSNMGFSMTYSFTDLLNDNYSRMGAIRQSESNYIRHYTTRKGTSNSDIQYMLPTFTKDLTDATNKHTLVLDTINSSIGYDGEFTTYSEAAFDCNLNYYLFARNEYLNDAASIACAKIKIYQAKIYSNGVLVRDFIPVEYNNIGYLYDKVSGEFFANQGTGKFVLGHRAPRFDGKACARSYTRRQLMSFKLPYDAEIEYLQNPVGGFIRLPYKPSNNTGYEIRWCKADTQSIERVPLGCWHAWNNTMWGDDFREQGTQILCCWGNSYKSISSNTYPATNFVIWKRVNDKFYYNGSNVVTNTSYTFQSNNDIFLFGLNINNVNPTYDKPMKIAYCKIFDSTTNELFFDLIPVRKGTTGYMYDKISGQLFGNAGTGNFILGPDKH